MVDVAIIGGGLSGLVAAYYLKRGGRSVTVLEKSSRVGGAVASHSFLNFTVDIGTNTVAESNAATANLMDALGLRSQMLFADDVAGRRYIVRDGEMMPLPANPPALLASPLFSFSAKGQLMREPFIPPRTDGVEETLAEFVTRRLGKEVLEYAINPFIAGTYAANPEDLSAKSTFKILSTLEKESGSIIKGFLARQTKSDGVVKNYSGKLFSFENGFFTVIETLRTALASELRTASDVTTIAKTESGFSLTLHSGETLDCKAVILATPAFDAAALVGPISRDAADALMKINYSPVAQLFLAYSKAAITRPLDGFGVLVPRVEGRKILGAVWNSSIFPSRFPDHAVFTLFIGGSRQPDLLGLTDDDLIREALDDFEKLMRLKNTTPLVQYLVRWTKAIPQYSVGHEAKMGVLRAAESSHQGLYFCANYKGGISVPDCIQNAESLATKILSDESA
jgi:oxygen-dependent protoporphyrinogen oxidase